MSSNEARVQAVHQISNREPMPNATPQRLEDMWATNVFNLSKMQASLPKTVFKSLKETEIVVVVAKPTTTISQAYTSQQMMQLGFIVAVIIIIIGLFS